MQEDMQVNKLNKEPKYVAKVKSYNGELPSYLCDFVYYNVENTLKGVNDEIIGSWISSANGNSEFIHKVNCSHLNGGEWEFYEVAKEEGNFTWYKLIDGVKGMEDLINVEEHVNNAQPLKQPKPKKQKVWCVFEEDYCGGTLTKVFNSKKKANNFAEKQLVWYSIVKMKVN